MGWFDFLCKKVNFYQESFQIVNILSKIEISEVTLCKQNKNKKTFSFASNVKQRFIFHEALYCLRLLVLCEIEHKILPPDIKARGLFSGIIYSHEDTVGGLQFAHFPFPLFRSTPICLPAKTSLES